MDSRQENPSAQRPRPFVGGRPAARAQPVATSGLQRPFSFATTARRDNTETVATTSPSAAGDTARWTVAVYEPGLEHVEGPASYSAPSLEVLAPALESSPDPLDVPSGGDDHTGASLALADGVREAGRHATSAAAADILVSVAHKLRRGEILLPAGTSPRHEVAVVAAVLAALLGDSR